MPKPDTRRITLLKDFYDDLLQRKSREQRFLELAATQGVSETKASKKLKTGQAPVPFSFVNISKSRIDEDQVQQELNYEFTKLWLERFTLDPPTSAEVQIGLIMVAKTNALCGKDASKEELEEWAATESGLERALPAKVFRLLSRTTNSRKGSKVSELKDIIIQKFKDSGVVRRLRSPRNYERGNSGDSAVISSSAACGSVEDQRETLPMEVVEADPGCQDSQVPFHLEERQPDPTQFEQDLEKELEKAGEAHSQEVPPGLVEDAPETSVVEEIIEEIVIEEEEAMLTDDELVEFPTNESEMPQSSNPVGEQGTELTQEVEVIQSAGVETEREEVEVQVIESGDEATSGTVKGTFQDTRGKLAAPEIPSDLAAQAELAAEKLGAMGSNDDVQLLEAQRKMRQAVRKQDPEANDKQNEDQDMHAEDEQIKHELREEDNEPKTKGRGRGRGGGGRGRGRGRGKKTSENSEKDTKQISKEKGSAPPHPEQTPHGDEQLESADFKPPPQEKQSEPAPANMDILQKHDEPASAKTKENTAPANMDNTQKHDERASASTEENNNKKRSTAQDKEDDEGAPGSTEENNCKKKNKTQHKESSSKANKRSPEQSQDDKADKDTTTQEPPKKTARLSEDARVINLAKISVLIGEDFFFIPETVSAAEGGKSWTLRPPESVLEKNKTAKPIQCLLVGQFYVIPAKDDLSTVLARIKSLHSFLKANNAGGSTISWGKFDSIASAWSVSKIAAGWTQLSGGTAN